MITFINLCYSLVLQEILSHWSKNIDQNTIFQAGRRNTQGERNMTNKPIYIKIYDKIKSAIKGGTMVMDTRTTQNYNQVTSLPEKDWLRLLETGYNGQIYESKAIESEELPDTFSIENAYFASPESLLIFLEDLIRGKYGNIFRAKGQLPAGSCWFQFDVAHSRYGITGCEPQKAGKSVFIGTDIHRQAIRRMVLSKMIQKKIHVKKR